jgi:hypothetical protein
MFVANPSDPGADDLDRHHQRIGQQHGPENVEAKFGARLTVGRNSARVIVRGARDQPGPKLGDPCVFCIDSAASLVAFTAIFRVCFVHIQTVCFIRMQ